MKVSVLRRALPASLHLALCCSLILLCDARSVELEQVKDAPVKAARGSVPSYRVYEEPDEGVQVGVDRPSNDEPNQQVKEASPEVGVAAHVEKNEGVEQTRVRRSVLATGQPEQQQTADTVGKSSESDKTSVIDDQAQLAKALDADGVRRLDANVEEVKSVVPEAADSSPVANSNVGDKVHVSQAIVEVNQVQAVSNEGVRSVSDGDVAESVSKTQTESVDEDAVIFPDNAILLGRISQRLDESPSTNIPSSQLAASQYQRLEFWKQQALELQGKIRDSAYVQSLQEQASSVLPGIAKINEEQFLEMLRTIITKFSIQVSNEIDTTDLRSKGLNENQIEIIKCAQQLSAEKGRQSFSENITQCIQGFDIMNCMRIFILPIFVEYMPEAFTQVFTNPPVEFNVADLFQGNNKKTKSARQAPFIGLYMNPIDPDALVHNILSDGLLRNTVYEDTKSYIAAKNETFSKLLSCSKMNILQMTEKFLPENARQAYSDEMLSCMRRFEYFSCIKYFAWPTLRQHFPALPQFPLSDSYVASLSHQSNPLITYPGYENGFTQLPEIIESGPARNKLEVVIAQILRNGLSSYARITPTPLPPQLDLLTRGHHHVSQDQLTSVFLAEQFLPADLRYDYVTRTIQCIAQFDYYNCMKYSTWPLIRQFNPSLPEFPTFQDLINRVQEIPGVSSLFNFFSQFQFPQFQIPQFQLPQFSIPQFSIPQFALPEFPSIPFNISQYFPPAGQVPTPKPPVDLPPFPGQGQADNKPNDTAAASRVYQNTELESRLYQILKNVRDAMEPTPLSPLPYADKKVFLFPLMTEDQSRIFGLAEGILPPLAREPLLTSTYFCLNDKNEFSTCFKTIIWPFMRSYVKDLPEFPIEQPLNDRGYFGNNPLHPNTIPNGIPNFAGGDNSFAMQEVEKFFARGSENAMQFIIRSIQNISPGSFNIQKLTEILRSIQFNNPEFINAQMYQYPRLPSFSSILTATQENIVHAAENIVPEQLREKYRQDMIKCAQFNNFATCSRDIIFPYVSTYIKNALSSPFNYQVAKKDTIKPNDVDPNRIWPKMSLSNQEGSNSIPANQFDFKPSQMPIYPIDPESVILSMLRHSQITAKRLPDAPKLSIANTPEFAKVFNIPRQAHILTVAEAILPEENREGFLAKMFECAQRDTFLNCSRDILFPTMRAAYSEFPSYPNFEHEHDNFQILSVIQILEQRSLTPEMLTRYASRSLPHMDDLYKSASGDKSDYLKVLIASLPDSLYYDLYLKMTQCAQFSDGVYCSHDIVYPALKQYYNPPGFDIDQYYPISALPVLSPPLSNQRSSFDYEMFCENMGTVCTLTPFGTRQGLSSPHLSSNSLESPVVPFGRLRDGSRIFKHTQDVWDSNITASVGADQTIGSAATSQSPRSSVDDHDKLTRDQTSSNYFSNQPKDSFNRVKRNVDDLLDSYSDSIPIDKKNSVPKRTPSESIFNSLTETELLQFLVHESKSRNKHLSGNEDLTANDYFVYTLNETDKALLTADQYEILKLVQGLNDETAKASFMSKLFRCIRSLSFIRCMGIFVWPMISSNLPQLPFLSAGSREYHARDEQHTQGIVRKTPAEIEIELLDRKQQIESNLIHLYRKLTEEEFEMTLGSMKVHGHGHGELALTFPSAREGRYSKLKDDRNLPKILNAVNEVIDGIFKVKSTKMRNKKELLKKNRSLHGYEEAHFGKILRHSSNMKDSERSLPDEKVINILLDKIRPSTSGIKDEDVKYHPNFDDAYRAFQVLFGPKMTAKLANQLTMLKIEDLKNFEDNLGSMKDEDAIKVVPLESQRKFHSKKSKNLMPRGPAFFIPSKTSRKLDFPEEDGVMPDLLFHLKKHIADYVKNHLNVDQENPQTGLTVHLPKLHDNISSGRRTKNEEVSEGRGKKKGGEGGGMMMMSEKMMPAAGMVGMMMMHMAMAHAKAAASVANLLSNMALGSAVLGMLKDMMMGNSDQPKIKYVYESEKPGSGNPWSSDRLGGLKTVPTLFPPSPPVFTEPY